MSRCFPFPPPGYENKARTDDTDLLTEEKCKGKRHKKDKKDKENREGKERKDKDRRKEKRRENDRKEKYKDRKEKYKDKEKNHNADEKRVEGQSESCSAKKSVPNSSLQNVETKDSKYSEELAGRIKVEDRATGSQMVEKISFTNKKRAEFPKRVVESNIGKQFEKKEKTKDNKEDDRKVNGQKHHINKRGFENAIVQNFSGMDKKKVGGILKPVEKDIEKQVDGTERIKHKESDDEQERERKSKSKDKEMDKEKEKEEKAKEKSKQSKGQAKLKDSCRDSLNSSNIKTSEILKESGKSSAGEGYLGKRKEPEMNEFLHDNGFWPNKLPRPVSSSRPVMENGRKLEPCQTAIQFASERQGATYSCKVDIKENRINGFKGVQQPSVRSTRPLSTTLQVKENGDVCTKPPHPDTKYLSQIHSVPKLEEFPDIDDQEWLWGSNNLESKKSSVGSPGIEGTQVWAEALHIESADIFALPYVFPY